jgi:hypothetical protein
MNSYVGSELPKGVTLISPSKRTLAGRPDLTPHMAPRLGAALFDLATSIVAYLALTALMFVASRFSYLLVLVLALPAAGFLVRTGSIFTRPITTYMPTSGRVCPDNRANRATIARSRSR